MDQEEMCRCGHTRAAHEHFRPGTDCGRCPETCARFDSVEARHPLPTAVRRLRRELRLI